MIELNILKEKKVEVRLEALILINVCIQQISQRECN